MDNETLRKVQLTLLDIAKELKRVCEVLGINYFLDSGTLLGAVRHQGFIPWDDDLDVGMLRKDYNLFLEKAPNILDNKYFLQSWYSDKDYGLAFAKIRMKDTKYIEEASQYSKAENGFYIDIFPYDTFPDAKHDQKWQGKQYAFLRRCILVKCGYTPWVMNALGAKKILKKMGYLPIQFYASLYDRNTLIKRYEEACTRFNGQNTGFLYEQAGSSNYGKWVVSENCLKEFLELKFEDDMFSCPKDYDSYLRSVYGDYMILPPEDKRINRHHILEIRFAQE